MRFFQLKINQKLSLILCLGFTLFLVSCSSSKKLVVHRGKLGKVDKVGNVDKGDKSDHGDKTEHVAEVEREKDDPDNKVNKVIFTARTYIGTPYKYGGTTRSGMDCSGLLLNSFKAVEFNLPRSSAAQSHVGKEIKRMNDLEPGDLVFFATGKKKDEITHVGLVTDVKAKDNIKFIHSSSSLGVVETNLYAEYYQKRYRGARRVIRTD
ncbi:MAG: C40 family peptidase [Chryseolinea sp.]